MSKLYELVLILGDGDLTFSRSLAQGLAARQSVLFNTFKMSSSSNEPEKEWRIVATCFDDEKSAHVKYRDLPKTLRDIRRTGLVDVHFGVDAMQDLSHLLSLPLSTSTLSKTCMETPKHFTHALFNFPHIGYESAELNGRLVAHASQQVARVLHPDGLLYISLTQEQCIRWKLRERISRHGFICNGSHLINEQIYPGYSMKRHQNGKAFSRRVASCRTYVFSWKKFEDGTPGRERDLGIDNDMTASLPKRSLLTECSRGHNHTTLMMKTGMFPQENEIDELNDGLREGKGQSADIQMVEKMQINTRPKPKKRRRVHDLTAPYITSTDNGSLCIVCNKSFTLQHACRAHVYEQHIIRRENVDADDNDDEGSKEGGIRVKMEGEKREIYSCTQCDKTFASTGALKSHRLSKHGSLSALDLKPAWAAIKTKSHTKTNIEVEAVVISEIQQVVGEKSEIFSMSKNGDIDVNDYECQWATCLGCGAVLEGYAKDIDETIYAAAVQEHLLTIRPPELKEIRCKHCSATFRDERAYNQHLTVKHQKTDMGETEE
jgi:hypothetical protein